MYQMSQESDLGLVRHPHSAQHKPAVDPPESFRPLTQSTHRKSLPTARIATATTAVIVFQAQEHQRREDHLRAREGFSVGAKGSLPFLSCQ